MYLRMSACMPVCVSNARMYVCMSTLCAMDVCLYVSLYLCV